MKIIQINAVYGYSSIGRITKELHEFLLKAGYDSYVAAHNIPKTKNNHIKISNNLDMIIHNFYSHLTGKQGYINHFNSSLPAFKDYRYIKDDDGRLLFSIYAGWNFVDTKLFFKTWNDLAKENGLKGFRFISYAMHPEDDKKALAKGFDCVTHDFVTMRPNSISYLKRKWKNFLIKYFKKPFLYDYNDYIQVIKEQGVADEHHYPCVIPNFDHSSRSSSYGTIYGNATPEKWEEVLKIALNKENKNEKNRFVFIKAWNEWGEGNYLEPDLKFGRGWLEAVKNAIASAGK